MKRVFAIMAILGLGGCGGVENGFFGQSQPAPAQNSAPAPAAEVPATADTLDTTSAEDRAEAVEATAGGVTTDLGLTIASLGAVGEPGIWLKTPLVTAPARGRVEYPERGTAVAVDLIPLEAAPGSGSRISLAAMRLIEADLTALPELRVYRTE